MKILNYLFLFSNAVFGQFRRSNTKILKIYSNLCNRNTCGACSEALLNAFHFQTFEPNFYKCDILFQLPKCCDPLTPMIPARKMSIQRFLI